MKLLVRLMFIGAFTGCLVFAEAVKSNAGLSKADAKETKSKSPVYQQMMAASEKLMNEYRSKNGKPGNVAVAVMDIDSVGDAVKKLDLGSGIGDMITSQMGKISQVKVIDRKRMKTIMKELTLSLSGVVDETSTKQVGRILAADLILTGSVSQIGNTMSVALRMTDVETAQQVSATTAELPAGELIPSAQVAGIEDKYPATAAFRSLSVPGWGHFYNGQPGWGVVYLVTTLGLLAASTTVTIYGANLYRNYNLINDVNYRDYYPTATSPQDAAKRGYDDAQFFLTVAMGGWIATGAVWLINVFHAGFAAGDIAMKKKKYSAGLDAERLRFYAFSTGTDHQVLFTYSF